MRLNSPVPISCGRCGAETLKRTSAQKYCDGCQSVVARELNTARAKRRREGKAPAIGSAMKCQRCAADVVFRGGLHRYCDPCSQTISNERNKELERLKRRAAGIDELGAARTCPTCSAAFEWVNPAQIECEACAAATETRHRSKANKRYRKVHGDRLRAQEARARAADPDAFRQRYARHKARHPDAGRLRAAAYNERNRDLINAKSRERNKTPEKRMYIAQWCRNKSKTDPKYNLNCRMRSAVRRHLREGKQGRAWRSLVGYSIEDLHQHIEMQFMPGMSWDNMADWHIDHILPLASFNYARASDPEFRAAWALTNLRPLWSVENLQKGAKRLLLL